MITMPQRIEQLRTERGLSRPALSAALGFPKNAVEKFEAGRQTPSQEQQEKLAAYFGVSVFYLKGESTDPTQMSDWMDGAFLDVPVPAAPQKPRAAKTGLARRRARVRDASGLSFGRKTVSGGPSGRRAGCAPLPGGTGADHRSNQKRAEGLTASFACPAWHLSAAPPLRRLERRRSGGAFCDGGRGSAAVSELAAVRSDRAFFGDRTVKGEKLPEPVRSGGFFADVPAEHATLRLWPLAAQVVHTPGCGGRGREALRMPPQRNFLRRRTCLGTLCFLRLLRISKGNFCLYPSSPRRRSMTA